MKRIGAIIGFSLLHLFVTMCLFAIVFSRGMAAFDKGSTEVTALDWIVGHGIDGFVVSVLSLRIVVTCCERQHIRLGSGLRYEYALGMRALPFI